MQPVIMMVYSAIVLTTTEAIAAACALAGREVADHQHEADREDDELDRGEQPLDEGPAGAVAAGAFGPGVQRLGGPLVPTPGFKTNGGVQEGAGHAAQSIEQPTYCQLKWT